MKQKRNATTRADGPRPLIVLAVGIAVTAVVLALIGWFTVGTHRTVTHLVSEGLRLQELRGTILQFDEVLTMSTRMAAATGDARWEKRYRRFEPALGAAIKEAIDLAPDVYRSEAATQADEANLKLVEMENRAFEFVQQDKGDRATELLFSEEYEKQKELYADGMTKLDATLGRHVQEQIEHYRGRTIRMGTLGLVAVIALVVGWIVALLAARTHLQKQLVAEAALEDAHLHLQHRVEERTKELAQANKDMQIEITERRRAEEAQERVRVEAEASARRAKQALADVERLGAVMLDREERVLDMKQEVNNLLAELGQERKYEHV